jgi:hypothetical protein
MAKRRSGRSTRGYGSRRSLLDKPIDDFRNGMMDAVGGFVSGAILQAFSPAYTAILTSVGVPFAGFLVPLAFALITLAMTVTGIQSLFRGSVSFLAGLGLISYYLQDWLTLVMVVAAMCLAAYLWLKE